MGQPIPSQRRLAIVSEVSRETIAKFARGETVRPTVRRRILRGMVELGMITGSDLDAETARALGLDDGNTGAK